MNINELLDNLTPNQIRKIMQSNKIWSDYYHTIRSRDGSGCYTMNTFDDEGGKITIDVVAYVHNNETIRIRMTGGDCI